MQPQKFRVQIRLSVGWVDLEVGQTVRLSFIKSRFEEQLLT